MTGYVQESYAKMRDELDNFNKVQQQLSDLHKNVSRALEEAESINYSRNDGLIRENKELKNEIFDLNARISGLEDKIDSFSGVEDELRNADQKIADLQEELREKTELFERLGAAMHNLPTKRGATSPLSQAQPKRMKQSMSRSVEDYYQDTYSERHRDGSKSKRRFRDFSPDEHQSTYDELCENSHYSTTENAKIRVREYLDQVTPQHSRAPATPTSNSSNANNISYKPRTHTGEITVLGRAKIQPPIGPKDHHTHPPTTSRDVWPLALNQTMAAPQQKFNRRLVCHACYKERKKCDNKIVCKNCQTAGLECTRTLCAEYEMNSECKYSNCFKVHDEQGYKIIDFNPFGPFRNGSHFGNQRSSKA
jgi:hypothetical protein